MYEEKKAEEIGPGLLKSNDIKKLINQSLKRCLMQALRCLNIIVNKEADW